MNTKKLCLLLIAIVGLSSNYVYGDDIVLSASSATLTSMASSTIATNVTTLGSAIQTAVPFASLTINSNNGAGYTLSIASANLGALVLSGITSPIPTQTIPYTINAKIDSGSVGVGLSNSLPLITQSLASSVTHAFTGAATTLTNDLVLSLEFNTGQQDILGGSFLDTVTVTITDS
jgi:hypothetical protein